MRSKQLIIITGILITSCVAEDSSPAIAAVDYRLFCDAGNGCSGLESKPNRFDERAIDGHVDEKQKKRFSVHCSTGDKLADLILNYDVTATDDSESDYAFSIESSAPGNASDCRIRIIEGKNVYQKSCVVRGGSDAADCSENAADYTDDIAEMPCQVSVTNEGSTVTGTVCCRNIPEELKQSQGNEHSLVSSQDLGKPAGFEFKNCT